MLLRRFLILNRYRGDAIRQAYLLLGSSELLGNPVGLLQNLGTGVRDFFYEPAQGLVRYSVAGFGTGLARGTMSLALHSTTGVALWISKLAGNAQSIINEMYDRCVNPMLFSLGADETSRTAMESSGLLNRNRPPATTIRRRLLLEIESHQIEDADGGAFKIEKLKCSKLCHYNRL